MIKSWRANIKDINDLYDLDPIQVMIEMRHMYLLSAKDLINNDLDMSENCCQVAEQLQSAIELQVEDQEILRY